MEEAFELQAEIPEKIRTGIWVRALTYLPMALAPWQGVCHRRLDCHLGRLLAEQATAPGRLLFALYPHHARNMHCYTPAGGRLLHLQQCSMAPQLLCGRRGDHALPP